MEERLKKLEETMKLMEDRHTEDLKRIEDRHAEDLKRIEDKHADDLKRIENKHAGDLKELEEKINKMGYNQLEFLKNMGLLLQLLYLI